MPEAIADHSLNASSQRELFEACKGRTLVHLESDLNEQGCVPETLPQDPEQPDDSIWIVISQRCDLIKGLSAEPTVALVRATKEPVHEATGRTRRSSWQTIVRRQNGYAWVADLREIAIIPKTLLQDFKPRQCLPEGDDERRRFALALGQRLWRRPVPREIDERITARLIKKRKKGEWKDFFAAISQFLVGKNDDTGQLCLYGVVHHSNSDVDPWLARFFYETVLPYLCEDEDGWLDHESSELAAADTVTILQVFDTYKLDLDYLSSKSEGSEAYY